MKCCSSFLPYSGPQNPCFDHKQGTSCAVTSRPYFLALAGTILRPQAESLCAAFAVPQSAYAISKAAIWLHSTCQLAEHLWRVSKH